MLIIFWITSTGKYNSGCSFVTNFQFNSRKLMIKTDKIKSTKSLSIRGNTTQFPDRPYGNYTQQPSVHPGFQNIRPIYIPLYVIFSFANLCIVGLIMVCSTTLHYLVSNKWRWRYSPHTTWYSTCVTLSYAFIPLWVNPILMPSVNTNTENSIPSINSS